MCRTQQSLSDKENLRTAEQDPRSIGHFPSDVNARVLGTQLRDHQATRCLYDRFSQRHQASRCCHRLITSSIGVPRRCPSFPGLLRNPLITLLSQRKQIERATRIASLPSVYHSPISVQDGEILAKPIEELVQDVHKDIIQPIDILRTYGKIAVKAHEKTNCLTEVMLPEAESWTENEVNLKGPLAGIPVSLKDSIAVGGFDVSVGYSRNTGKPYAQDGTMVRILKDAGL